jgi:hypothetical protein
MRLQNLGGCYQLFAVFVGLLEAGIPFRDLLMTDARPFLGFGHG